MQRLKIADEFLPKVASGEKTVTIRKGLRPLTLGPAIIENASGTVDVPITITGLRLSDWHHVAVQEICAGGITNPEEYWSVMKDIYPDITENSKLTVITFTREESV